MSQGRKLRDLMKSEGLVVAPGAYECITAKLIQRAGFPAVYMTGAGTAATLGYPDYGLVTMSEMADNAGRIAAAVDLPLIADADTGYGNELNAYRTVQEYERRGLAGMHIEDQTFPKKCGHLDDKELIPLDDYVAKIRAAADARRDRDFVIIARTDARAGAGFEEAARRCNAALEAGADVAFFEAPQTVDEIRQVPKAVKGPCLLNVVRGGKSPEIELDAAKAFGYRIAIVPALLFTGVMGLCEQLLAELKRTRVHPKPPGDLGPREAFARIGAADWDPRREKYRTPGAAKTAAE